MPPITSRKFKSYAIAGTAALALSACTSVPGANLAAGSPITQEEAELGAKYHADFVAEFGGAYDGTTGEYVKQVGQNIAVQSGLSNARESFTVTFLNSPVPNAFAVPGGYVYSTRGLVALMNNEAELAAVLGHEVGHVSARHSARRQQTAQRNQLLGVLGQVLSGVLLGNSALGRLGQQISSTAPQLATLSYSRGQELEADELGIQYLNSAGYDPKAMATVLASLAAQNSLDAQLQGRDARMPEWASTHPDPAGRIQTAMQKAGPGAGIVNRDTFLTRIDNLMYGDDPEQGVIEGRQFTHPDFRLSFTAPDGFYMINSTRAVSVNGDAGRAQLSARAYSGNLETYVRQVFSEIGGEQQQLAPQQLERTSVNGITAAHGITRVNTGQSEVDVVVFAYEFASNQAFHFAALTPAGRASVFNPMFQSMRRISASEAAAVTPRRINVVTVQRGDTVASLARRMAYSDAPEARFRVLNGLSSSDTVTPGQKVKIVIRTSS